MSRKKLIIAAFALLAFVGLYFTARWGLDVLEDQRELADLNQTIDQIITASGLPEISSFEQKIDAARAFVNDNSEHNIDKEFYAVWGNHKKLAQEVLLYAKKERDSLPNMECSTRANLVGQILNREGGYKIRNVVLYNPYDELRTHRAIDIRDPSTGLWHTQDPDYDVYWKNAKIGSRASLVNVAANVDDHVPCGRTECGWQHKSGEGKAADILKNYSRIVTLHDKKTDRRVSLYGPEIDPDKIYEQYEGKKGTFCEIYPNNCEDGFIPASDYKEY
jgi:hypothetical protein